MRHGAIEGEKRKQRAIVGAEARKKDRGLYRGQRAVESRGPYIRQRAIEGAESRRGFENCRGVKGL
jgi:hypothetical protein